MHQFRCTADGPVVKSFLFYNLLLFPMANFFKPAGTDIFLAPNKNYATIFIFYLHIHFSVAEYKAIKFFNQLVYMLNHEHFLTLCYNFVNKSN